MFSLEEILHFQVNDFCSIGQGRFIEFSIIAFIFRVKPEIKKKSAENIPVLGKEI